MKILITQFAERHFDKKFGGTKILDHTIEEFEHIINHDDSLITFALRNHGTAHGILDHVKVHDGYAPFCKLVAVRNFTDARVGSLPITLENYSFIRSGYSGRRDSELPIFSRWLELPLGRPKAEWLMLVLYSKEQIDKEANENVAEGEYGVSFNGDWGVVAILGQSHSDEEPMKPETMIRNAGYNTEEFQKKALADFMNMLNIGDGIEITKEEVKAILNLQGTMVGGSGVPLNREKYLASVDFWDKNISLK